MDVARTSGFDRKAHQRAIEASRKAGQHAQKARLRAIELQQDAVTVRDRAYELLAVRPLRANRDRVDRTAGMGRLDVVRVQIGDRTVAISWDDGVAIRAELDRMGLVAIEREFADVGTSRPVRIAPGERASLLAAVTRVEHPSSRLDVLREALQD